MVMAVDESLVKLELSEAGEPTAFEKTRALKPYGPVSIGWVSEDWKTKDGSPIGIGGDPSGASALKNGVSMSSEYQCYLPDSQRPDAPHGNTSPVRVTGSPSSSDFTVPPWVEATSVESI